MGPVRGGATILFFVECFLIFHAIFEHFYLIEKKITLIFSYYMFLVLVLSFFIFSSRNHFILSFCFFIALPIPQGGESSY